MKLELFFGGKTGLPGNHAILLRFLSSRLEKSDAGRSI
jgi:hypothetical protein